MSELLDVATKLSEYLWGQSEQKLPHEILVLNAETVGIVIDREGVDYMLTMMRLPRQRERPSSQ